jgi:hypothetical protein
MMCEIIWQDRMTSRKNDLARSKSSCSSRVIRTISRKTETDEYYGTYVALHRYFLPYVRNLL